MRASLSALGSVTVDVFDSGTTDAIARLKVVEATGDLDAAAGAWLGTVRGVVA